MSKSFVPSTDKFYKFSYLKLSSANVYLSVIVGTLFEKKFDKGPRFQMESIRMFLNFFDLRYKTRHFLESIFA